MSTDPNPQSERSRQSDRVSNKSARQPMAEQMTAQFDRRRRQLGMTFDVLSERSGVPISTLKNIFGKGVQQATFSNVLSIADALGIHVDASPRKDVYDFREEQAKRKARQLVSQVQATMELESQGLESDFTEEMVREMVHKLMAGSPRKLWA